MCIWFERGACLYLVIHVVGVCFVLCALRVSCVVRCARCTVTKVMMMMTMMIATMRRKMITLMIVTMVVVYMMTLTMQ